MNNTSLTSAAYSRGAVILHWLIAVLIVANFLIAELSEDMAKEDRMAMMGNHKAIGITILGLTVLRIVWRFLRPAPPLVETLKAWEAALAKVTHALLYFLMLAIPLSGWGMVSGKGNPVSLFGLFNVPALPVGPDKATNDVFHELHEVFATLMLVLFVIHVAAAIKHMVVDKDGTMARMAPWMKR
ncbi:MAG: cytochrome b [Novosphingobium sp.]|nr:cytochrome b [Novosphingobium sp.]